MSCQRTTAGVGWMQTKRMCGWASCVSDLSVQLHGAVHTWSPLHSLVIHVWHGTQQQRATAVASSSGSYCMQQ